MMFKLFRGHVKITAKDAAGMDEQYAMFFYCPKCGEDQIIWGHRYCALCGVKVWFDIPDGDEFWGEGE